MRFVRWPEPCLSLVAGTLLPRLSSPWVASSFHRSLSSYVLRRIMEKESVVPDVIDTVPPSTVEVILNLFIFFLILVRFKISLVVLISRQ